MRGTSARGLWDGLLPLPTAAQDQGSSGESGAEPPLEGGWGAGTAPEWQVAAGEATVPRYPAASS